MKGVNMEWYGEKFDENNPNKYRLSWITRQIKNDLNNFFNKKEWKFSVSKASSQSINVIIKQMPKNALLDEVVNNLNEYIKNNFLSFDRIVKDEICNMIYKIINSYNYDKSESQFDYYDKNYYVHVSLTDKYGKQVKFI